MPPTLRLFATYNSIELGLCRQGRYSGILENHDLGEEMVVQVFHLLSFVGCVFSIMLCLLPLAVEQILLLRQFYLHVGEHLEELGFVNERWVDASNCPM